MNSIVSGCSYGLLHLPLIIFLFLGSNLNAQKKHKVYLNEKDELISEIEYKHEPVFSIKIFGERETKDTIFFKIIPQVEYGSLDSSQLHSVYNLLANYIPVNRNQLTFIEYIELPEEADLSELYYPEFSSYQEYLQHYLIPYSPMNYINIYDDPTSIELFDNLYPVFKDIGHTITNNFVRYKTFLPSFIVLEPNGKFAKFTSQNNDLRRYSKFNELKKYLFQAQDRLELMQGYEELFFDPEGNKISKTEFYNSLNPETYVSLKTKDENAKLEHHKLIYKQNSGRLKKSELQLLNQQLDSYRKQRLQSVSILFYFPDNFTGFKRLDKGYFKSYKKMYKKANKLIPSNFFHIISESGIIQYNNQPFPIYSDKNNFIQDLLFKDYHIRSGYAVVFPDGRYKTYYKLDEVYPKYLYEDLLALKKENK